MKYIVLILCIAFGLLCEYLFFAFVAWQFNAADWHWLIRLIASICIPFAITISAAFAIIIVDNYKIK